MPTIDANILLRWLLDDVPSQTAAAEKLLTGSGKYAVPDIALIETAFVLERVMLLSRTTVAQSVELVLGLAAADVNRQIWRMALDDYLTHPKLSIADTFLHAHATATKRLPLLTFDQKLARQLTGAELPGR